MPNFKSFAPATRLASLDPSGTVFSYYTALAIKHNAVNLGQGFPSLPVADFILDAAKSAVSHPSLGHQYARSQGHPRLVNALASYYSPKLNLNRNLDAMNEIITTVGASEAIYSTITALINPNDEVIIMQPFYDSYPASIALAGGIPITVSLKPTGDGLLAKDWKLDFNDLESKITKKTKMIILNNPNNPLGKVWDRSELEQLANIATKHNLLVLADEVYESLALEDSSPMIKFASLPGMFERTLTVGSMGKMFGVTGWKIGWLIAPAELTKYCWMVHQYIPFAVASPLQEAGGIALEKALSNNYFSEMRTVYRELRDLLYNSLLKNGFNPTFPDAGYFIICNVKDFNIKQDFSTYLTEQVGVTSIPMSAFYNSGEKQKVEHLIRFAYCKDMEMLQEANIRLEKLNK